MNKREKEVIQSQLADETAVLDSLKVEYQRAINSINRKIRILQSDELTQSKIYQIQYQKVLREQIEYILEDMHGKEFSTIQKYLEDCYESGYVGTMYDIAGQGIPIIMPIDQASAIKAVQLDSNISKGLYTRLGIDVASLKKSIASEVTRGIATSLSWADMARNLNNAAGTGLSNATRIARTEGHRIQQTAADDARQAAKSKGADVVKQWDASLDGRTRDTHRLLDGQIREVDEPFEVDGKSAMYPGQFGDPAEDCNCRCVALTRAKWALDDAELQTLKDRAEYFGLDKTKEFDDFKNNYLQAASEVSKIENQSTFVPAKTIEEAQIYAERFVSSYKSKYSGNVSFKGMGLEYANKVNKVLTETYEKYGADKLGNLTVMNFRETKWKKAVEDGVAAAYQWGGNGGTMFVNQKLFASSETVSEFTKKADDILQTVLGGVDKLLGKEGIKPLQKTYLNALKTTGVQCVAQSVDDFAEATFVHEVGHSLDDKLFRKLFKEAGFDLSSSIGEYAGNISGYAVASQQEYVAESFTSFWYGKTDVLDPKLVEIFKGAML